MAEGFLQKATIESAFVPVDISTGANAGDWVSLENYTRVVCVLFAAAGTAGDDPVIDINQATSAAGANTKAVEFTVINEKVGTLTSVTSWTRTTQTAAGTYTNAASAEAQKIMAVEVRADELDVDNGFTFLQMSIADVGTNAQIGCAFYIMLDPRYPQGAAISALS